MSPNHPLSLPKRSEESECMSVGLSFLGEINGPILGYIMKEAVTRAMRAIRAMRLNLTADRKGLTADGEDDWVTDADDIAQEIYLSIITEAFPLIGVVAEERELRILCRIDGHNVYFTIDPLDGTRAAKNLQSDGIGTMISLVIDGVTVAVCIGDIMTGEVYYYRPESEKTHRIDLDGGAMDLEIDTDKPLSDHFLHMRKLPDRLRSRRICTLLAAADTSPFYETHVSRGSIGLSVAKLWKGEFGAYVLSASTSTPWDSNPIMAISRRLGFVAFELHENRMTRFELNPTETIIPQDHDILLIHGSSQTELFAWCDTHNIGHSSTD